MTDETVDSVLEWVRSYIEGRGIRDICWTFYGGEPLLNMDQMVRLGYGLKEVCEQNSLGYSTRIVTNGSLLNSEIIRLLGDLNLTHIQITLDGPREVHDLRRCFSDGTGSFDTILTNITLLRSSVARFTLRINVDRDTILTVTELLDELATRKPLDPSSICLEIHPVFDWNWQSEGCGSVIPDKEFQQIADLYRYGLARGFKIAHPGALHYCSAMCCNAFEIAPSGDIYGCPIFTSSKNNDFILGRVDKEDFNPVYFKLMTTELNDEECMKCAYFPLCQMGCRADVVKTTGEIHGKVCNKQHIEKNLPQMLSLYFSQILS